MLDNVIVTAGRVVAMATARRCGRDATRDSVAQSSSLAVRWKRQKIQHQQRTETTTTTSTTTTKVRRGRGNETAVEGDGGRIHGESGNSGRRERWDFVHLADVARVRAWVQVAQMYVCTPPENGKRPPDTAAALQTSARRAGDGGLQRPFTRHDKIIPVAAAAGDVGRYVVVTATFVRPCSPRPRCSFRDVEHADHKADAGFLNIQPQISNRSTRRLFERSRKKNCSTSCETPYVNLMHNLF